MRLLLVALAIAFTFLPAHAQQPRVFVLDAKLLSSVKALPESSPEKQHIVHLAQAEADRVLSAGPFTVTSKGITPPSGDKHDYMSQAPYFWPDPAKPDGKPYIRRDGERNPEIRKITDHDTLGHLGEVTRTLALAYYFTGDRKYADRAALLLRTWFLDPATRMNPNLEFGQGIPGINTGRGIGIIESRSFTDTADAAGLLAGSAAWTPKDEAALEDWYRQYIHWMRSSKKGQDEDAAKNNHGTWYDYQLTDYALFVNDRSLAHDIAERAKSKRIQLQVEPDGRQPLELARTKAFGYSEGNLDGLMHTAELGRQVGVDLYSFRTADGRSIRAALDYLIPFALGEKPWGYQQIDGFNGRMLTNCTEMAALDLRDPKYVAAAEKLSEGRDDLATALFRYALAHPQAA